MRPQPSPREGRSQTPGARAVCGHRGGDLTCTPTKDAEGVVCPRDTEMRWVRHLLVPPRPRVVLCGHIFDEEERLKLVKRPAHTTPYCASMSHLPLGLLFEEGDLSSNSDIATD